jgi:tRNA (cmo5U34)-methyltransferase
MADFFDERSDGYDEHMHRSIASFESFYGAIAHAISLTDERVRILDLGCGTGLELGPIFERAPNARITGIDLSAGMLEHLRREHTARLGQIALVQGSYLELAFGAGAYDYGVSVMTLHHLLPAEKQRLYGRIQRALKPGGRYIEGDYVAAVESWDRILSHHQEKLRLAAASGTGLYHIDVPLPTAMQCEILLEAGFSDVEVHWIEEEAAVFVAST